MTSYQLGETVSYEIYFYNSSDVLTDPTTYVISIIDTDGTTQIDEATLTYASLGTYTYNYTLATDVEIGLWKVIIKATNATETRISNDSFRVIN